MFQQKTLDTYAVQGKVTPLHAIRV